MTVLRHELRQGRTAFFIWTGVIGFLLAVCVFLYPQMKSEMESIGSVFSSMGAFTSAFGMDKLNFGTITGYYAIECGNVLGLGGALFAAITAGAMLSKEERNGTAEFLFTHPVSRTRAVAEKALAVLIFVIAMNLAVFGLSLLSILIVKESVPFAEIALLHLAYLLMQIEIASVCFGMSAFLEKGSVAAALGVAILLYAVNLIGNVTDKAAFLSYISPFGYCDGASITAERRLDGVKLAIGGALTLAGAVTAFLRYRRKDLK